MEIIHESLSTKKAKARKVQAKAAWEPIAAEPLQEGEENINDEDIGSE